MTGSEFPETTDALLVGSFWKPRVLPIYRRLNSRKRDVFLVVEALGGVCALVKGRRQIEWER